MNTAPKCWAVIPAAGIGERVGGAKPKQYLQIAGKTVIEHAVSCLVNNERIAGLVFSLNPGDKYFSTLDLANSTLPIYTVDGGESRAESVLNGLNCLNGYANDDDFVLVHDAARPCLTLSDLHALMDYCFQDGVGGILATPVTDTIKKVSQDRVVNTLDRDEIWRALTPQMFKFKLLKDAIQTSINNRIVITDEASAIEMIGHKPGVVEGSEQNIKVTKPNDLIIAELILQSTEKAEK